LRSGFGEVEGEDEGSGGEKREVMALLDWRVERRVRASL
jgi:hypothetical protein